MWYQQDRISRRGKKGGSGDDGHDIALLAGPGEAPASLPSARGAPLAKNSISTTCINISSAKNLRAESNRVDSRSHCALNIQTSVKFEETQTLRVRCGKTARGRLNESSIDGKFSKNSSNFEHSTRGASASPRHSRERVADEVAVRQSSW